MNQYSRRNASAWLVGPLMLFSLFACSGGSAPNRPAGPQQSVAQPAQDPFEGASRAPGSERYQPDEHPELARLTYVSTESLADAITSYVRSESNARRGTFPVPSPNGGPTMRLMLATVHRERLSRLADGRYFACADFDEANGNAYDVDIFMRAESKGLVPSDIIVHKVNGTPLFTWSERDGIWSAVPITK